MDISLVVSCPQTNEAPPLLTSTPTPVIASPGWPLSVGPKSLPQLERHSSRRRGWDKRASPPPPTRASSQVHIYWEKRLLQMPFRPHGIYYAAILTASTVYCLQKSLPSRAAVSASHQSKTPLVADTGTSLIRTQLAELALLLQLSTDTLENPFYGFSSGNLHFYLEPSFGSFN